MATVLTDSEFLDLVAGTLRNMDKPNWENIAQELQIYEVMGKWMKSDRMIIGDGRSIVRFLMTNIPESCRHVGNLEEDVVNIEDVMDEIEVPFVKLTTNWAITRPETEDNTGKSLIFNVMAPRRAARMLDVASTLETTAWAAPSATDARLPWGVLYYVVKNATQGFTGARPSGFTTVAGIDPTSVTDWCNWSDTYETISYEDLIEAIDLATIRTKFISPVSVPDNRRALAQRFRLYCNVPSGLALKRLYRSQNQDLGVDLAVEDGLVTVKGHPIVPLPILDADTSNPFYGLDMNTFYPVVKSGSNFRESEPRYAPTQHDVLVVYVDHRYNYLCVNRKANFVIYVA
jgi:hypothetical protein